jgi:glutamate-ammonia-ligase adenylyltransferase
MDSATSSHTITALATLCPELDPALVRDFVRRMDPEYFEACRMNDIAAHLRLVARLTPGQPSQVMIMPRSKGHLDLVVVAYDYFSEFAIICGLLSAFGLDIREGSIYTFTEVQDEHSAKPQPRAPRRFPATRPRDRTEGLSRKKIVDLFHVTPTPGTTFGQSEEARLRETLAAMLHLLDSGRLMDARHLVNRLLVEAFGRSPSTFSALLNPVQIIFDNANSPTDTVMDIRSTDTPAFLYAFASALAMRGVYIRKARFENRGSVLYDRFYVRSRHGAKIEDPQQQQELQVTATLTKQFTHFLRAAPDPAKAMDAFDQFLDRIFRESQDGSALRLLGKRDTLALLAKLFGASDFLWEDFLRRQYDNLLPMLNAYQRTPLLRSRTTLTRELRRRLADARSDTHQRQVLNQYKDEELFRIDMKHLLEPASTLSEFSAALTELAEVVVGETARLCQARLSRTFGKPRLGSGRACPFTIFGIGKFGGRELGYASDIELLFVYGGSGETKSQRPVANSEYFERLAQDILQWIEAKQEGIFHLDVRLRPHGGKGLLANTVQELRRYYSLTGLSAPFERQALIKLRHVWGDASLGRQVEGHRDRFVYSGQAWDLEAALDLRRQQRSELTVPGQTNVKYSSGGLIDIEYAVQYLQIMHGDHHPSLQTPNTLEAIKALGKTTVLALAEAEQLRADYLFLRTLIDALRIVRGNAKDLVLPPEDSEAYVFLSRRLGYRTDPWQEGARRLAGTIAETMSRTERFFTREFGGGQPSQQRRAKTPRQD